MVGVAQVRRASAQLAEQGVGLEVEEEVRAWLSERGYSTAYGARPLQRLFTKTVCHPLSHAACAPPECLHPSGVGPVQGPRLAGQLELGVKPLAADSEGTLLASRSWMRCRVRCSARRGQREIACWFARWQQLRARRMAAVEQAGKAVCTLRLLASSLNSVRT